MSSDSDLFDVVCTFGLVRKICFVQNDNIYGKFLEIWIFKSFLPTGCSLPGI